MIIQPRSIYCQLYDLDTLGQKGKSVMIRLRVKEVARSKGISQGKLSRLSDVNLTTIQHIYKNPTETNVTLYTLDKIAKALDVDPRELIENVPD